VGHLDKNRLREGLTVLFLGPGLLNLSSSIMADGKESSAAKTEVGSEEGGEKNENENKAKLKEQLEFYFSDPNLRRDEFMVTEMEKSEEKWFPVATLLNFNRVKSLTENLEDVMEAVRKIDSLELNEDASKVRRKVPFVDNESSEDVQKRSIFASGFPVTYRLNHCRAPFEKLLGEDKVVYLKMRKGTHNRFNGSVFIELKDEETAQSAFEKRDEITLEDGAKLKEVALMADWVSKEEEKIKKRKKEEEGEGMHVIALEGLSKDCSRETLEVICQKAHDKIDVFARYKRGDSLAYLHLHSREDVELALKALKEATAEDFAGSVPSSLKILEGDAEKEYKAELKKKQNSNKKRRRS